MPLVGSIKYVNEAGDLLKHADEVGVQVTKNLDTVINLNIKPNVTNSKLQNIINDLYKGQNGANTIGNGTTMDAVRNENITGKPTNGKYHRQKLEEYITALEKRLRNGDLNEYDEFIVKELLKDSKNALNGN